MPAGPLMVAVFVREVLVTATGLLAAAAAVAVPVATADSAACSCRGCLCFGDVAAEEGACRVLQQQWYCFELA